jgi:hypothetical protein
MDGMLPKIYGMVLALQKLAKTGMHAQSSSILFHAGIMEDFDQTREMRFELNDYQR